MSSETSTEQFYLLLAMIAATVAVVVSRNTHPVALVLLSAAILGAGFVAVAIHRALAGFFGKDEAEPVLGTRARDELLREKSLVLRSIKELEFDRSMGKISDADFAQLSAPLRARALALMQAIERTPTPAASKPHAVGSSGTLVCASCGRTNDADARFCKSCGTKLEAA
jgi:hypothetical protein